MSDGACYLQVPRYYYAHTRWSIMHDMLCLWETAGLLNAALPFIWDMIALDRVLVAALFGHNRSSEMQYMPNTKPLIEGKWWISKAHSAAFVIAYFCTHYSYRACFPSKIPKLAAWSACIQSASCSFCLLSGFWLDFVYGSLRCLRIQVYGQVLSLWLRESRGRLFNTRAALRRLDTSPLGSASTGTLSPSCIRSKISSGVPSCIILLDGNG